MKFQKVTKWLLVVNIILFFVHSTSAVIPSPSIEIKPTNGSVGSSVSVKGTGFSMDAEVRIYWEDKLLASTETSSNGEFSASIKVPQAPCGYYKIKAVDEVQYNAYATFRVTPKITKISTTKGAPGTVVNISGNGFSASSEVDLRFVDPFNETWILSEKRVYANESGVIQAGFEIPQVSAGEYRIFAIDSKTGLKTEYSKFTVVEPKATPTPKTTQPQDQTNKTNQTNQTNQTTKPTTTPKATPKTPVTYSPRSTPGFELLLALAGISTALLVSRKR
ncbi:MAG: IPT/TIG domain-containing protein [Archaeoglobaceae archaeon]|nr:IPT/TIG domain-containing protein [Archaeoglobaceae archaeon]MDW8118494.1 IPT/TIG domain-containing protein [Archaeoglobaceae archaeon]